MFFVIRQGIQWIKKTNAWKTVWKFCLAKISYHLWKECVAFMYKLLESKNAATEDVAFCNEVVKHIMEPFLVSENLRYIFFLLTFNNCFAAAH